MTLYIDYNGNIKKFRKNNKYLDKILKYIGSIEKFTDYSYSIKISTNFNDGYVELSAFVHNNLIHRSLKLVDGYSIAWIEKDGDKRPLILDKNMLDLVHWSDENNIPISIAREGNIYLSGEDYSGGLIPVLNYLMDNEIKNMCVNLKEADEYGFNCYYLPRTTSIGIKDPKIEKIFHNKP
ncbi:MAG: hypothetical protein ACPLX8_02070, partial [Nanopusillaceae archaeon]